MHILPDFEQIVALRQKLHQNPELSGKECLTANCIVEFLEKYDPTDIITELGGTGIAAIFDGIRKDGPTVLFRAELDALPIKDINDSPYKSLNEGISHKCGHDGHMAILTGLAALLHKHKLPKGRVILLFQPAEETGQGALAVLEDKRFSTLKPDYVFALHNLPGIQESKIVVRNNTFAAASTGMVITLQGKSSHAAEPENGLNPGQAMAEIILEFNRLILDKDKFKDLTLLTVIHARLGEVAFGTNPGFATVMATLRSFQQEDLILLKQLTSDTVKTIAAKYKLVFTIDYVEEFPATVNDDSAVNIIRKAAEKNKLETQEAVQPFKWSEDFGYFTNKYKGALFGLGAGSDQAQLHHAHYDFPDAIIPTGSAMFYTIASEILQP